MKDVVNIMKAKEKTFRKYQFSKEFDFEAKGLLFRLEMTIASLENHPKNEVYFNKVSYAQTVLNKLELLKQLDSIQEQINTVTNQAMNSVEFFKADEISSVKEGLNKFKERLADIVCTLVNAANIEGCYKLIDSFKSSAKEFVQNLAETVRNTAMNSPITIPIISQ